MRLGALNIIEKLPSDWTNITACYYEGSRNNSTVLMPATIQEESPDTTYLRIENEENGCFDLLAYSSGIYLGISRHPDSLNYAGVLDLDCWQRITKPKGLFIFLKWSGIGSLGTIYLADEEGNSHNVNFQGGQDIFEFPDITSGSFTLSIYGGSTGFSYDGTSENLNIELVTFNVTMLAFNVIDDFSILTVSIKQTGGGGQGGGGTN